MARRSVQDMPASPLTPRALSALVLLLPLVYWTSLRDYTLPPGLLVLQAVLALAFAAWLISGVHTLRLPAFGLPAAVYLLANAASLLYASDPAAGLLELTKILSGFLLFVVVSNRLRKDGVLRILNVWVLTGAAISLLGIVEHLGWRPFPIPSAGLPSATLGYRNIAAMYLIQSIPMALGLFAVARSGTAVWTAALAAAFMSAFLVYTRTRGAWVGLAGAALVTICFLIATRSTGNPAPAFPRFKRTAAAAALALFLALALLPSGLPKVGPQSIDEKKADIETAVTSILSPGGGRGRITMWRHTLEMFRDNPLPGVGLGNWAVHYPRYDRGDRITLNAAPERPHSDPLCILSEVGLLGLIPYIWLGVAALVAAWRNLRSPDPQTRRLSAACLAGLLAISIHSLFDFPRERIVPTALFWLTLGILAALAPSASRPAARGRSARTLVGLSLLLVLLQLALTWRIFRFESHMHRARHAERRGDWKAVVRETGGALDAGCFHPEAVHLRGYALNLLGEFSASRELYSAALRRRPYDIQMLNGMAIAAQNLGALDEAHARYLQVLDLIPDLPDIRYNLAGLYLRMRRPGRAAAEYRAVLAREGESPDLCYRLGAALALDGRADAAIDAYHWALRLDPAHAGAQFALAELLYHQRRLKEALQAYRAFLRHGKGGPRYAEAARRRIAEITSGRPE